MITNILNTNNESKINGTSFHDHYLKTTLNKLKKVFGKYYHGNDKTSAEFFLELEDGTVFTIYDYKEYGHTPYKYQNEEFDFHIGAHSKVQAQRAYEAVTKLLEKGE